MRINDIKRQFAFKVWDEDAIATKGSSLNRRAFARGALAGLGLLAGLTRPQTARSADDSDEYVLVNRHYRWVEVQVRIGNQLNCQDKPQLRTYKFTDRKKIVSDQEVCYRFIGSDERRSTGPWNRASRLFENTVREGAGHEDRPGPVPPKEENTTPPPGLNGTGVVVSIPPGKKLEVRMKFHNGSSRLRIRNHGGPADNRKIGEWYSGKTRTAKWAKRNKGGGAKSVKIYHRTNMWLAGYQFRGVTFSESGSWKILKFGSGGRDATLKYRIVD